MSFPKKLRIPTAVETTSNFDIDETHLTTGNFFEFSIARACEVVPKSGLENFKFETFSRLEPLAKPTMGLAQIRNKVFWVPFRTVFPAWNDFNNDVKHVYDVVGGTGDTTQYAHTPHVPLITNKVFYEAFTDSTFSRPVQQGEVFDFFDGTTGYKLNRVGRFAWKTIRTLGYDPIMHPDCDDKSSLLPLLCLFRVYADWFFPANYVQDLTYSRIMKYCQRNVLPSSTGSSITTQDLLGILSGIINLSYDPSYLVSAWDYPTGPNYGSSSDYQLDDVNNIPGNNSNSVVTFKGSSDGNLISKNSPVLSSLSSSGNASSINYITDYGLKALRALTDYLKRHQLAGGRTLDRYLARWGVKLSSEQLNKSQLIHTYNQDIKFGDVTSTSSTDGASLGDYAGKGISYGDSTFNFDSNGEYGMLIFVSTIIPQVENSQGIHRHTKHISRLDFFTPEFDGLGVQAIACNEAYVPNVFNSSDNTTNYVNKVFGFTPRYAEYKVPYNLVTGDFALPSRNVGEDSWYLNRDLKPIFEESGGLTGFKHKLDFIMSRDSEQYKRIFQNINQNVDNFKIIYRFSGKCRFPGRPLFDNYDFHHEEYSDSVSVDVNGSTVN